MAIAPELTHPAELLALPETAHYFNRERSWLEFNRRVLEEALDEQNPLLERVKFLSIFSTNLDEFFMIRVAGIKQQVAAGVIGRSPDGTTPAEQLIAIRRTVDMLTDQHRRCWLDDVQPKLRDQGIRLLDYAELTDQQRAFCKEYFEREVFPVLTPLAFDPSHPFPQISNLSINLAVVINDPEEGELFARLKVPAVLPRLIPLPSGMCDGPERIPPERRHCLVWLEQVIGENV
ncbi:MAG: RNA degradosome polyphosphate kinase, partial [Roseiflexaceae bacterium]